jgi:RecA-family ATPase
MNVNWKDPRNHPKIRADMMVGIMEAVLRGESDAQITRSMVGVVFKAGDSRIQELIDEARALIAAETAPIKWLDVTAWDTLKPEPRRWAVQNHIPLRQPTLLSGAGGVGKSILLLQLLCSSVLSRDWIGLLPEAGPVIYLGAEDDEEELHRRIDAIVQHSGERFEGMEDLHVTSYAGMDATLGRANRAGIIEPTPLFERLLEQASDIRPSMIGLDTVSDIFAGNENDRSQVSAFVGMMRRLAMASDSAVIINTHPSLTGISTGSGLSGSTGWHNRVRSRMYFKPVTTDDGDEVDPDLRLLEFHKNQYGPLGASILLRWKDGVFVPEPRAGSLDQALADRRVDDLFMALLERFTREGRNVSSNRSPTFAPTNFAAEPEAKAIRGSVKAFDDAMRRLFAAGKIHVVVEGSPSRSRSRLAIGAAPAGTDPQ